MTLSRGLTIRKQAQKIQRLNDHISFEKWNSHADQLALLTDRRGTSYRAVITISSNAMIARSTIQRIANRFEVTGMFTGITYSEIIHYSHLAQKTFKSGCVQPS